MATDPPAQGGTIPVRDQECVALLQWALPRLGLRWPGFRRVRRQVCKRISRRMTELGLHDAAAYRIRLEADAAEWSVLDACCAISISRFCRDRAVFEDVAREILPNLARAAIARERYLLRAWSAGCASGEEPYSLRLVWDLAVAPAFPDVQLHIVGTDASAELLRRARRAAYPTSALEELPATWRARAFEWSDRAYRLRDEFRRGVEFHQQDIRRVMPGGPFDLILCRNLAFTYFELELQRLIQRKLAQRLVPGGALLIGAHEALPERAALAPSAGTRGLYRAASTVREDLNGSPS
jgi:chemotaxis protein methyltransferase CheR